MIQYIQLSSGSENDGKVNTTSLIMDFIQSELESIDDSSLDKEMKKRRKYLIGLCNLSKSYHITDAQNLKSVFDFFRNSKIEFHK